MKRIISIVIVNIFLMHFIGFYAYFVVRQNQIRQEMRAAIGSIPNEEFETFVFTLAEYQSVRVNDHEVKIDGRMYDHSAPKFENGNVILFARHDQDEDNLISMLSKMVQSASSDKKPVPSQLFNFLSLIFISPDNIVLAPYGERTQFFSSPCPLLLDPIFAIASPPPRQAV